MSFGIFDFFKDIGNFFRGGSVLGIDIGTTSIKVIELKKIGDIYSLKNYGLLETKDYLDHPNQAIQTSSLKISIPETAEALRIILSEMNVGSKSVIASLPSFSFFSTTLDIPLFSESETKKAISYQARQFIPLPLKEVAIEWRKIEEYKSLEGIPHQRVLLIATPRDIINSYKEIFSKAKCHLIDLEIESFALARGISGSLTDTVTAIVDIGSISTSITIVSNGVIEYIGQTDYSSVYITQSLSRSLEISMTRAEELKRRRGLLGDGIESELSTILLPFLDVIIQETRHVKDRYEKQFGKKVEKIMLVGGGAELLGVDKYFSSQIGLLIGHHSFTSGMSFPSSLVSAQKDIDSRFVAAYGCARRYFS